MRPGQAHRAITPDVIARIDEEEIRVQVGISHGSVHAIIKDHLNFRNICAQRVPHQLMEGQKFDRMAACLSHLQRYHEEEYEFLSRIITGEETWCHHHFKTPSDEIILLHDNAHSHTANLMRDKLQRFSCKTLQHPLYSPDHSPCDFHIFGDLKKDIRGRRFHSDEEVQEWVRLWIRG
ncbi:hypothetical protein J437_LFUL014491 [Ladona fulva]|uniref:Transposase n=1 Tax=Ladona fulva TaxID=123851 RepID=A0A8K0P667_LADFU|nr:hypothetical protein J437_LFUL014491 [Ladona fulva]